MNNLLLSALSPKSYEFLIAYCVPVALPVTSELYVAHEMPRFAYFMTSGLASVITTTSEGQSAEVGMVGREGIVGAMHLLGPMAAPTNCMVQLEATALRISLHHLKRAFDTSKEIQERVLEVLQEQSFSLSQIAGCHALHEADARLARWLLMAQDRTQSEVLRFTQEFLAEMIGAQRTTVSVIAAGFQRRNMIEYSRGKVRIIDRKALESAACGCYQVVKHMYQNLSSSKESEVLSEKSLSMRDTRP
jgi:CRP-like cAMP-binding protein